MCLELVANFTKTLNSKLKRVKDVCLKNPFVNFRRNPVHFIMQMKLLKTIK